MVTMVYNTARGMNIPGLKSGKNVYKKIDTKNINGIWAAVPVNAILNAYKTKL